MDAMCTSAASLRASGRPTGNRPEPLECGGQDVLGLLIWRARDSCERRHHALVLGMLGSQHGDPAGCRAIPTHLPSLLRDDAILAASLGSLLRELEDGLDAPSQVVIGQVARTFKLSLQGRCRGGCDRIDQQPARNGRMPLRQLAGSCDIISERPTVRRWLPSSVPAIPEREVVDPDEVGPLGAPLLQLLRHLIGWPLLDQNPLRYTLQVV